MGSHAAARAPPRPREQRVTGHVDAFDGERVHESPTTELTGQEATSDMNTITLPQGREVELDRLADTKLSRMKAAGTALAALGGGHTWYQVELEERTCYAPISPGLLADYAKRIEPRESVHGGTNERISMPVDRSANGPLGSISSSTCSTSQRSQTTRTANSSCADTLGGTSSATSPPDRAQSAKRPSSASSRAAWWSQAIRPTKCA